MEKSKIDRINALAKKSREQGLTDSEKAEQLTLRQEYLRGIRQNLTAQLENTYIIDENGTKTPLKKPGK